MKKRLCFILKAFYSFINKNEPKMKDSSTSPLNYEQNYVAERIERNERINSKSSYKVNTGVQCDKVYSNRSTPQQVEMLKNQLEALRAEIIRLQSAHLNLESQIRSKSPPRNVYKETHSSSFQEILTDRINKTRRNVSFGTFYSLNISEMY